MVLCLANVITVVDLLQYYREFEDSKDFVEPDLRHITSRPAAVSLGNRRFVFPADARVQREPRAEPPVVVEVGGIGGGATGRAE